MPDATVPKAILSGLRPVTSLTGAEILGEPFWAREADKWVLNAALDIGDGAKNATNVAYVPRRSEWFVLLDSAYPLGTIDIYPSKQNSITATFPHQLLNRSGPSDRPWRAGKICLDAPVQRLGLIAEGQDPIGDQEERLSWYLGRATAWIRAASEGTLVQDGDPFELPDCPTNGELRLVHDESETSFGAWENVKAGDWGVVLWEMLKGIDGTALATAFLSPKGDRLRVTSQYDEPRQGSINAKGSHAAFWWLWPSPIVLKPWQVPVTWGELRNLGEEVGVDVDGTLREISRNMRREDNHSNLLLLGYPIPRRWGDDPIEVHWQAVSIPKTVASRKPPNGFRANEQGFWHRDRNSAFGQSNPITYAKTENWHPDRLQARGRLRPGLRTARVALIGCGALGSVIAELLVRGGVGDLLLIDHDLLAAQNLVRHTLSGREIGKNKAEALADRLGTISPFSTVRGHGGQLPAVRQPAETLLQDREIVIDCTGAQETLLRLAQGWWDIAKLFVSASVGFEARKTYFFAHRGHSFPADEFQRKIEPFLEKERTDWAEKGETIEGSGCWSPLFPARLDDLFLSGASSIKAIEEFVDRRGVEARFVVFEQTSNHGYGGLRRSEPEEEPQTSEP